jgi:hypothetical protein
VLDDRWRATGRPRSPAGSARCRLSRQCG